MSEQEMRILDDIRISTHVVLNRIMEIENRALDLPPDYRRAIEAICLCTRSDMTFLQEILK